ncbi:hypothetical protein VCRA2110O183_310029 [Vibrio crassostreae]|nr:hypothetical protein VCRA2110O183_310029 [Vibrio crassostreae]CAK2895944.1 hypothetical protein VCRA2121O264_310029 [Vibrio crassostreae]CAK3565610.1 hypothetical protein VCRA2121O262_320038 [Vibrio crassostreae]
MLSNELYFISQFLMERNPIGPSAKLYMTAQIFHEVVS